VLVDAVKVAQRKRLHKTASCVDGDLAFGGLNKRQHLDFFSSNIGPGSNMINPSTLLNLNQAGGMDNLVPNVDFV
jgi:hypothetical protein